MSEPRRYWTDSKLIRESKPFGPIVDRGKVETVILASDFDAYKAHVQGLLQQAREALSTGKEYARDLLGKDDDSILEAIAGAQGVL